MKTLLTLVMMQLKDKIDLSFAKDKRQLLNKIVFSVLKFLIISGVSFGIVFICYRLLGVFYWTNIPAVMLVVVTLLLVLSIISCTAGLVQTMYFADDNKVLVTFPVSENTVFISKLLVFYFYEVIKSFSLLIPVLMGFLVNMLISNVISGWVFLGIWIPLLVYMAIPVLIGALLSIPALYIVRFFKRYKVVGYALFVLVLSAVVYGVVSLIAIMPENINVMAVYQQDILPAIRTFLLFVEENAHFMKWIISSFIGEKFTWGVYMYDFNTFLAFGAMLLFAALMIAIVFFTTKFIFYNAMRRSFEFEKNAKDEQKKNVVHSVGVTFLLKELRLNLRSIATVLNFLSVYIVVPILVFLMNKVFSAIDTSIRGDNLAFAFNILPIMLPLMASNSLIASAYSKEGRAAYIKKTKPISVIWPLTSKMFLNFIGSFLSVVVSVLVFASFNDFTPIMIILLIVGLTAFQYGHMFISATLDIMNPLNERYATEGEVASNKNENLSTLLAFSISFVLALYTFFMYNESYIYSTSATLDLLFIKTCVVGLIVLAVAVYMFITNVKAYYYER